jgi:hypothetical protein
MQDKENIISFGMLVECRQATLALAGNAGCCCCCCCAPQAVYSDDVHNLVSRATPVSPVRTIGALNNTWTHYEQVRSPASPTLWTVNSC